MAYDKKKFLHQKPMDASEERAIHERLVRARIQIIMNFNFFGILALNLDLQKDYTIPTAATDGKRYYYNPYFIKTLSEPELNWVTIHEVMHPALQHLWRRGSKQPKLWNAACDYAIHSLMNEYLDSDNSCRNTLKMPEGCLYDSKYNGKSAEEIYDILMQQQNQGGGGQGEGGQGDESFDDHSKWDDPETQENPEQKRAEWEGNMVGAAKAAESKMAGNLPGFMKRLLGKLFKPQKDYRQILAEFVEYVNDDYGFSPPDRRYSDYDFFMPALTDQTACVKNIICYVDTSGSIGDRELTVAYSEIVGAVEQFQGKLSGKLGFFDHIAYGLTDFDDVESVLAIKPEGGGGTNFHAPFEYITENIEEEEVAGIIIITDGYCDFPDEKIANGKPVLWLIVNEEVTPPWGIHGVLKV